MYFVAPLKFRSLPSVRTRTIISRQIFCLSLLSAIPYSSYENYTSQDPFFKLSTCLVQPVGGTWRILKVRRGEKIEYSLPLPVLQGASPSVAENESSNFLALSGNSIPQGPCIPKGNPPVNSAPAGWFQLLVSCNTISHLFPLSL